MIPPPSRISHFVDHRTPAAESPMVLIVDTLAGVVVVFCSYFYARSSSHSVHIFCAKSTSYLFSNNFCTECPIFWYFTFWTTFFYLFIKILLKSVQDLSYLPEHGWQSERLWKCSGWAGIHIPSETLGAPGIRPYIQSFYCRSVCCSSSSCHLK